MRRARSPRQVLASVPAVLIVATFLLDPVPVRGEELLRLGSEFQVNSYSLDAQAYPAVARDADGDFVVTWGSFGGQDGADRGVFAQRFNSAGALVGAEFQVNSHTTGAQDLPSVALAPSGSFVIAWSAYGAQDGSNNGIFAQRFDAAGAPQGAEFQVNTHTLDHQLVPTVGADSEGDFVIAWSSWGGQDGDGQGIFAQRFDSAGVAQGAELPVNSTTAGDQTFPHVAVKPDGGFVVAWTSEDGQDGAGNGVFAQRFDSAGSPVGDEFQVNQTTSGDQSANSASIESDGEFVIAWTSLAQDGDGAGAFARRFGSSGAPQDGEFQVSAYTAGHQSAPRASHSSDGSFVIAWSDSLRDGSSSGVFAQHFDANGLRQGIEFQVNTVTASSQTAPALAGGTGGQFVVVWHSQDLYGTGLNVMGQRLEKPAVLDIDGNGQLTALTDGLLVLRRLFGLTGASLIGNAIGANCTRCDAPSIEAYLSTLM
jgi:hypothetical protein